MINLCLDCGKNIVKYSKRCKSCSNKTRAVRPVRTFNCQCCSKEVISRFLLRFCSLKCANNVLAKEKAARLTPSQRYEKGYSLRQWHNKNKALGINVNLERWGKAKDEKKRWVAYHKEVLIKLRNTPEYKAESSSRQQGASNFFHKMSEETYENLCLKRSARQKGKMQDVEYKEKIMQKTRLASKIKPTKPEITLLGIISKLGLYFKYVGDGTRWIAAVNPDFINTRDKQVIELFGCYWHKCPECLGQPYRLSEEEEKRILHFAQSTTMIL